MAHYDRHNEAKTNFYSYYSSEFNNNHKDLKYHKMCQFCHFWGEHENFGEKKIFVPQEPPQEGSIYPLGFLIVMEK